LYLTPRYNLGTASCDGTVNVVGSSASWASGGIKQGDQIHFGDAAQRNPSAVWHTINAVGGGSSITLISPGPNTGGLGVYTIRRVLTGGDNDVWSTELFHRGLPGPADWWIGTNGVDPVLKWNGVDTQVAEAGLDFTCKTLLHWKNMMIYANLDVGGSARRTSMRNSDIGDPFNVLTGVAAEFIVHDGVDEILSLLTLSDNLTIYSSRNITLVALVGLPELFAFRTAISGIGVLGSNAIVDYGDTHEFLGPDAAYEFDGVSTTEVNYQVMREVIRTMSPTRYSQIIAHFAEETGEIYWIVPLTTDLSESSPEKAYTEYYLEDVENDAPTPFTIREIPATATGYFESLDTVTWDQLTTTWAAQSFRWNDRFFLAAFPLNLFGRENGVVYKLGVAEAQDGAPIRSFVEFGRRPVIDGQVRGCVRRVIPFAARMPSASYPLNIVVKTTDQVVGDDVESVILEYDLTHGTKRFVNPFALGRFFSVEFGTNGVNQGWSLNGYDIENVPLGERDAP